MVILAKSKAPLNHLEWNLTICKHTDNMQKQQLKKQNESGTPYLAYVTTNGALPFLL